MSLLEALITAAPYDAVWVAVAMGMVAALLGLSVILVLREHGLLPFCRIAMLRRRSLAELTLVAVIVGVNGSASLTAWSSTGDHASVSERMERE